MDGFRHFDLKVFDPPFESPITDLIIELDHLRKRQLSGTTHPHIFFQLKSIFHMLESLGSARIEGNNTTLSEYIETKIAVPTISEMSVREIKNMEDCLQFIDENIESSKIDRAFISELHKMVVNGLPPPPEGEGDKTPGAYRAENIRIKNSPLITPNPALIHPYIEGLIEFIAFEDKPKYDLLKIAIAHHRFVWIHPFRNGNGRTVRMFTYAMLVKYGFNVKKGRILNPTAVFCNKRSDYYDRLGMADTGTTEGMLAWCEYVLHGLKIEIEKIDRLLEYTYLREKILLPAIHYSLERKFITEMEAKILRKVVEKQIVKASDLSQIIVAKHSSERSRIISRLKKRGMLLPIDDKARKYTLCFQNNYLLRGIINSLRDSGFDSDVFKD